MTDQILFETKDKIATITLNRPEALNAFSEEMIRAWVDALRECRDNDDIHVVVFDRRRPRLFRRRRRQSDEGKPGA